MTPLILTHTRSGASARILPEVGFNCYEFQASVGNRRVDVLDATPEFAATGNRPNHNGIPLLFPFPNRIRGSRFSWQGVDYTLSGIGDDGQGNAIHGLVIDRPWRVIARGENFAVGAFQLSVDAADRRAMWPADFLIEVRYELRESALRSEIRIVNPDRVPLPFGFGTHSYFRVPLDPSSRAGDCLLQAPATEEWELENCLPTGRRRPVAGRVDLCDGQTVSGPKLDNVLTGVVAERGLIRSIVMDPAAGLQMTQTTPDVFRELVVYTPPHGRSVCLEPYTCVTDAVHLSERGIDAGWRVLPPGAEFRTWIEIAVGLVIA